MTPAMKELLKYNFFILLLLTNDTLNNVNSLAATCTILSNGEEFCEQSSAKPTSWCTDDVIECEYWASIGECDANPKYMLTHCRRSCNACGEKTVFDALDLEAMEAVSAYGVKQKVDGTEAAQTLDVIRQTNEYMKGMLETEELSSEVLEKCQNRHELCAFWVTLGECENNPGYMVTNCAPSCKSCHLVDFEKRCPERDPRAKPGLLPGELDKMFERIVEEGAKDENNMTVMVFSRPGNEKEERRRDPWVITIDNFLTDEECDHLVQLGYKSGYERSRDVGKMKFDGSFDGHENKGRTSTNAWCSERDGCRDDPIVQQVMGRIVSTTGIPQENYEDFQMLKYEVGQFYQAHHDYIPYQKDRQCGPRILTFFQYLSDVEEGGGTNFPLLGDLTVQPKKGRVLLWPSVLNSDPSMKDEKTDHEALPVIKGTKFAANAWIHLYDFITPQKNGCV